MLLGIDVGGTYTDAVLAEGNEIIGSAKAPTTRGCLLTGILAALDGVLAQAKAKTVERITLSTTLVTNIIAEQKTQRVGVLVMPGPGMDITPLLPPDTRILSGSIDHRGREVTGVKRSEVKAAVVDFSREGISYFAVIGKFSVRNPAQELLAAKWLREECPAVRYIALGHQLAGNLNFPRRIHTAYLNAAVWADYQIFIDAAEEALRQRRLAAPVYILKADGGTLPLAVSRKTPVEAIFTGPAASILGVQALSEVGEPAASLDVGGTTTDIALWRNGLPLAAPRGVRIGRNLTQVRSFLTRSLGIGGDSWVRELNGELLIGPERKGLPAALGGPYPTITDALCVLGETTLGDPDLARRALSSLRPGAVEQIARQVLDQAAGYIADTVLEMIKSWEQEPCYRVFDLLRQPKFGLTKIIGVGGGAGGLTERVAARLGCKASLPPGGMAANAAGAAVARPTRLCTLRVDTEQNTMLYVEEGRQTPVTVAAVDEAAVVAAAQAHLAEQGAVARDSSREGMETVYAETFNVIRGFQRTGKIITVQVQLRPGILRKMTWKAGDIRVQ